MSDRMIEQQEEPPDSNDGVASVPLGTMDIAEVAPDAHVLSDDFFHGDVAGGLERVRKRLLDLSNRNRLLNFRYPKRSRSVLRVVDELPDQLCSALLDNTELFFDPVRQPSRRELYEWRERRIAEMRQRYGEHFESKVDLRAEYQAEPSVEEFARSIGIRTAYELPTPSPETQADERHNDQRIQTLLFPDDLERVCATLRSKARLAIEETGTNMLYLVLGFVEWYESDSSDQPRLAPLYLVPVSLTRHQPRPDRDTYEFGVSYSGEDRAPNISLQERLVRDFGLQLPDLEDDEPPESYIGRVKAAVSGRERWKVHRHATLCLLSFGKLLMYRDLDPDRWPGGSLTRHPKITDFFVGTEPRDANDADTRPLDSLDGIAPPIIEDADSSQHSALIDAALGKDLVIEGPPGTGKSQTITNLIASTVAADKTVLFVAEKLAALEVVRHRLDAAGMGLFCLELHSHRTHKKGFLEDIKIRLDARGSFPKTTDIEEMEEQRRALRDQLNRYAELINSPAGDLGMSVHEVLWGARRFRTRLGDHADRIVDYDEPRAMGLTRAAVDDEIRRLEAFMDALTAVVHGPATLEDHPWYGVRNSALSFLDRARVVGGVRVCRETASELASDLTPTAAAAGRIVGIIERIPAISPTMDESLLACLVDSDVRSAVKELLNATDQKAELQATLGQSCETAVENPARGLELSRAVLSTMQLLAEGSTVAAMREWRSDVDTALALLENLVVRRHQIESLLGVQLPDGMAAANVVCRVADLVRGAPVNLFGLRDQIGDIDALWMPAERLHTEQGRLLALRESLAARYDLSGSPPAPELRADASKLAGAGLFWWVSGELRAARNRFRSFARHRTKLKNDEMAAELRRLADFAEAKRRFEEDPALRHVAGDMAAGLDTRVADIITVIKWRRSVDVALREYDDVGRTIAASLWQSDSVDCEALRHQMTDCPASDAIVAAISSAIAPLDNVPVESSSLLRLKECLGEAAGGLAAANDAAAILSLPAAYTTQDVATLVRYTERLLQVLQEIAGNERARAVLGEHPDLLAARAAVEFLERLGALELPRSLFSRLFEGPFAEQRVKLLQEGASLQARLEAFHDALRSFIELCDMDVGVLTPDGDEDSVDLRALVAWADRALAAEADFELWTVLLASQAAIKTDSGRCLVDLAKTGEWPATHIADGFRFILFQALARKAFADQPDLRHFQGLDHERLRQAFARLDQQTIEATRKHIAAVLDERPVAFGNAIGPVRSYTELGLVEHEINKQKRHIPIRQLVRRAGPALQALKPCFMMGPLSVAQYLEPGGLTFDLVVMDEASQLRPEDALGAVARGGQLVVVGDSKQLPPTRFFDRIDDLDEEEDEDDDLTQGILEAESILDVAASAYRPSRVLQWHYRSRHGSLIAFSNEHFYHNRLIVFPSVVVKSALYGVELQRVRGRYRDRRNVIEAAEVVAYVLHWMQKRPDETLGIVTLNTTQRDLIQDEFDQQVKHHPSAQRYLTRWEEGLEPFFVKNLENVQGDERDAIVISMTYGPDQEGRVYQRFGPINSATGHRRLNVLFTRARNRVTVFTSLRSDDIRTTDQSAPGVHALKDYLYFAETGQLRHARFSGRDPDSDFEVEVADALTGRGFEVVAQVGVASYFIDLAVRHPNRPGAFVLGIECDGATYHSAKSARDRDRLRQQVLEDKGWTIHRIWSTDWFRDRAGQTDRVVAAIEAAIAQEPEAHVIDVMDDESSATLVASTDEPPPDGGHVTVDTAVAGEDYLSEEEARQQLEALRDGALATSFPEIAADENILRPALLDALLRERPTTREEWLRRIPLDLRIDTAPEHMVIVDDILDVLRRIR